MYFKKLSAKIRKIAFVRVSSRLFIDDAWYGNFPNPYASASERMRWFDLGIGLGLGLDFRLYRKYTLCTDGCLNWECSAAFTPQRWKSSDQLRIVTCETLMSVCLASIRTKHIIFYSDSRFPDFCTYSISPLLNGRIPIPE